MHISVFFERKKFKIGQFQANFFNFQKESGKTLLKFEKEFNERSFIHIGPSSLSNHRKLCTVFIKIWYVNSWTLVPTIFHLSVTLRKHPLTIWYALFRYQHPFLTIYIWICCIWIMYRWIDIPGKMKWETDVNRLSMFMLNVSLLGINGLEKCIHLETCQFFHIRPVWLAKNKKRHTCLMKKYQNPTFRGLKGIFETCKNNNILLFLLLSNL